MPLPILNSRHEPSHADLIRLFHKTENLWCEHLAGAEALDVGTAFANGELAEVWDANNVRDVALSDEAGPQQAFDEVEAHYASKGTKCFYWTFNPSAPAQRTQPLMDLLVARGYQVYSNDVMAMHQAQLRPSRELAGVKIIPARASFRHARQLWEEAAARFNTPGLVEAHMLHLDDPHWDALLALKDGEPVAFAGVLAVGEIGRIDDVYVAKAHRRQGLGDLMISRVLEISARSLFKHVLLSVFPKNAAAISLYQKFGFAKVGEIAGYFLPGLNCDPA